MQEAVHTTLLKEMRYNAPEHIFHRKVRKVYKDHKATDKAHNSQARTKAAGNSLLLYISVMNTLIEDLFTSNDF